MQAARTLSVPSMVRKVGTTGLEERPFTAATGVRIPLGTPLEKEKGNFGCPFLYLK